MNRMGAGTVGRHMPTVITLDDVTAAAHQGVNSARDRAVCVDCRRVAPAVGDDRYGTNILASV